MIYIERNNVEVTLSGLQEISSITVSGDGGGLIDWVCQKKRKQSDSDLCGSLYILDATFDSFSNNIFTIDLSLDPSQVSFNLDVDSSSFTNINATIFNFNHKNDELGPLQNSIRQRNMFVNIENSTFANNGRQKGYVKEWIYSYFQEKYIIIDTIDEWYKQNGTIFTINSAAVPNITIQNSHFTDNAGRYGTIFYWYCARYVQASEYDDYCGQISLQNTTFTGNEIAQVTDAGTSYTRFGSIIYALINQRQDFNLHINDCKFIEQEGNMMYFKAVDPIDILNPCLLSSNGTIFGNNTFLFGNNTSLFGNNTGCIPINGNSTSLFGNNSIINNGNGSISPYSHGAITNYDIPVSMIYIDNCTFINNTDKQSDTAQNGLAAILSVRELQMVFINIDNSTFIGSFCLKGAGIFGANYAPFINIHESIFNDSTGDAS